MIDAGTYGHGFAADLEVADFIVPKDLNMPAVHVLTSAWSDVMNSGQTVLMVIPTKSYWKLYDNPPQVIATFDKKDEMMAFHAVKLKELIGGDKDG